MNYYAVGFTVICFMAGLGILWIIRKNYRRHMLLVTSISTMLIAIIIYHNYLMGRASYLYSVSDGFTQFLPIYKNYIHILQEGDGFPLWNFSVGFGAVQGYLKFFYPTNLIPILMGFFCGENALAIAVSWMQILRMGLSAAAMFAFLKKLKFNDFVCLNMGFAYAFCGILILRGHWWTLADECYIAIFILWSAECYFRDKEWRFIPLSIALAASCLGVYYIYLYALELFIYGTVRYIYAGKPIKDYTKFIFTCGGLFLLGVLIAGMPLLDHGRAMFGTARYVSTKGYAESLSPLQHVQGDVFISAVFSLFDVNTTGVFHLYTGALNYLERPAFYCGLGSLFLIFQGLFLGEKRTKKLIVFGGLFAGLYILFPTITDIFNMFVKNEELGLRSYRLSSLWIVIMMIVMAGYGLQCGLKKGRFHRLGVLATGLGLLSVFLFCIYEAPKYKMSIEFNVCRWIFLFILGWTVCFIMFGIKASQNVFKIGTMIMISGIFLIEMGHSAKNTVNVGAVKANQYYDEMESDALGYYSDVSLAINYLKEYDPGIYRISGIRSTLSPYCSSLYFGIYDSSYYTNIDEYTYEFLREVYPESFVNNLGSKYSIGVGDNLYLSTLTGYKYRLVISGQEDSALYGYEKMATIGNIGIYKNNFALSLGITYDAYMKKSSFQNYTDEEQRKIMLYCMILEDDEKTSLREVSTNEIERFLKGDSENSYRTCVENRKQDEFYIESWKQDNISGRITVSDDGMLVLSIPNVKGWHIYVDGEPSEIHNANIGFMSVVLTAGEHLIQLKYEPVTFWPGIFISIMASVIYLGMIIIYRNQNQILLQRRLKI